METIYAVLGGAASAALISGTITLIQFFINRKDKKNTNEDVQTKALQYLMLYIIQSRCEEYIKRGSISLHERRSLRHWHDLYHNGLGGNGDADLLMEEIDHLPHKDEE